MATLLRWANALNRSDPAFGQAQSLSEDDESLIGRVIRRTKAHAGQCIMKERPASEGWSR